MEFTRPGASIVGRLLVSALAFLTAASVHAREYGNYDLKRIPTVAETPAGKKYGFDVAYFDQIMNDLSLHARSYPPRFDSPQDRQRATRDVQALSGMLDLLIGGPTANPELLVRAALLNSIGHNLDIPGAADKASQNFRKLLAAAPSEPRGNYLYGTFLAGTGKPKEALPYLEKASALGVPDAAYTLGMTHLTLGDKELALKHLEAYRRSRPQDQNIDRLIDAVRNGKVEIKKAPR